MTFIDNSAKTSWKFIGIVAIIATLIGSGILVLSLQKEVPPQIVEITKSNVVTEDEITDWQTYRNEKFGFEVKYPPGWKNTTKEDIVDDSSFQFSISDEMVTVQVEMGGDIELFELLQRAQTGETAEQNLIFYTKLKDEVIGSFPAVRYSADYRNIPANTFPAGEEVLVNREGKIVHFKIWGRSVEVVQKEQETFDKILSTFRFID